MVSRAVAQPKAARILEPFATDTIPRARTLDEIDDLRDELAAQAAADGDGEDDGEDEGGEVAG